MMFDYKKDLGVAVTPTLLSGELKKATVNSGVIRIVLYIVALAVINLIVTGVLAVVDGKDMMASAGVALMSSINVLILTLIGIIVTAAVATVIATYVFKAKPVYDKSIGLMSFTVLPIFAVGVVSNVLLLVSGLLGHILAGVFSTITGILLLVSALWMLYVGLNAVIVSHNIKPGPAVISFIIGFLIAIIINSYLLTILGTVSVGILTSAGLF